MNDSYKLLYNNLWLVDNVRISNLNPDYIMLKNTPNIALNDTPKYIDLSLKESNLDHSLANTTKDTPNHLKPNNLILDWENLVGTIKNCKLCSLCNNRQNVVIERGNRQAPWMFVGEAPGADEDKQGSPFVGLSGQLLDKMIKAMKLNQEKDVYICNVVKCRPPYNRNPEANEIAMCKNYLLSQIELVKPKIIIALGRFASQTLLNSNAAIGKLRGVVHKFNAIPLIVTYHPAYLLRNADVKKEAWDDLQLALRYGS